MNREAVKYAQKLSWKVFPVSFMTKKGLCSCNKKDCRKKGKHPVLQDGIMSATSDIGNIESFWKNNPKSNIGVLAGEDSGIIVIDIDKKLIESENEMKKLFGKYKKKGFPETPLAKTGGGGNHYYFKYNSKIDRSNSIEGIKILSDGDYVILPPSNHKTGMTYQWVKSPFETPLAPIPEWFIEELTCKAETVQDAVIKKEIVEPFIVKEDPVKEIKIPEIVPLDEYIENKCKIERARKREESSLVGYRLTQIPEIAKYIDGIMPGFYIVGAYTNIGKTAFLINLFYDLLNSNKGLKGLFFSFDDNKDVIINRLISIQTSIPINDIYWKQDDENKQQEIDEAYKNLINLSKSGRLKIFTLPEINDLDVFDAIVRKEAEEGKMIVSIDGLYNLEVNSKLKLQDSHEKNAIKANHIKTLADSYKIPIIITGEIKKRTHGANLNEPPTIYDLIETVDMGYNANIVWILHPKDRDIKAFNKEEKPVLELRFEKNKLSGYKGTVDLRFYKKASFMEIDRPVFIAQSVKE